MWVWFKLFLGYFLDPFVIMRDLLASYRLIIGGKITDSESDHDPLMSSSSSTTGYGTSAETTIFVQDTSCTESEDESKKPPLKTMFPTNIPPRENIYDRLERYPKKFGQVFYQTDDLIPVLRESIMISSSQESFDDLGPSKRSTNSSLVTIFSIWNTTMGSSLLAMAWGMGKSGLFSGIFINILIAAICLYTAYVLLDMNEKHGIAEQHFEVPDLCRLLIGRWAEMLAKTFSLIVLIGANIVYWILMSNFLYNAVYFVYGLFKISTEELMSTSGVLCPKDSSFNITTEPNLNSSSSDLLFGKIWDLYSTVPIVLAIIMFPLLNFKSPTFFTKFNSLGTISVGYILVFTAVKSFSWGANIQDWMEELRFKPSFVALSGMLSLSYFIHNIIISIMRHNKEQKHNGRDLIIAFSLITFTYVFIGTAFYISFPLAKYCIEDNILNNFSKWDAMTIIARILLLFQVFTVFPLISFMLRSDVFSNLSMIFKDKNYGNFSYGKVIIINFAIVFVCVMFACFLPKIGTLIRYTGALSGMVYIFLLPNLLKLASLRKEGNLTYIKMGVHILIIITGVVNLICQFFITDN